MQSAGRGQAFAFENSKGTDTTRSAEKGTYPPPNLEASLASRVEGLGTKGNASAGDHGIAGRESAATPIR